MKVIRDESELPAPPVYVTVQDAFEGEVQVPNRTRQYRYTRSLSDPRVYIHGVTGELYMRGDGLMWEHPGYKVDLNRADKVERYSAPAWGDIHQYPYAKQRAAA